MSLHGHFSDIVGTTIALNGPFAVDGSRHRALSSRLAYPEVRAALTAAARNHDITDSEFAAAERDWADFWAATRPVELTPAVEQHAGQLAEAHALRGAGAVHLASALAVGSTDLIVAVWDRRLHAGAQAAGCRVSPARLDP